METSRLWTDILVDVRQQVSEQTFDIWFKTAQLVSAGDGRYEVLVPNEIAAHRLSTEYKDLIERLIEKRLGRPAAISVNIEDQKEEFSLSATVKERRKQLTLDPRLTFDTFVVGAGNEFAHAACRKVGESPGTAYNPLLIYGGVGLGKTHLLNAIGNYQGETTGSRVVLMTSEQFTNEVINSIRRNKMEEFRNRYRTVDCLLIDDVQFFVGKEKTIEEFYHTFNTLHLSQRQIVLTSDRPAREIKLEDRVRSRFEMGLVVDIQPPDLETRIAILRKKASAMEVVLPEEVSLFLAERFKKNVRELEGALIRVAAFAVLTHQLITISLAKQTLVDSLPERKENLTADDIVKAVAEQFGLKSGDLKLKRRTKNLVLARQVAMYLCRQMIPHFSTNDIGRYFGGKDHSTVIHSTKQVERLMEANDTLRATVDGLAQKLKED